MSSHLIFVTTPNPDVKTYNSHLTDRETELREVMLLALGHTAGNWLKWKLNSHLPNIKACAFCFFSSRGEVFIDNAF